MTISHEDFIQHLEEAGLRETLATQQGRAFLRWIISCTGYGQNPFVPNALTMAFNAGMMQPGLDLVARIEQVDPAGLVRILKENYDVGSLDSGSEPDPAG